MMRVVFGIFAIAFALLSVPYDADAQSKAGKDRRDLDLQPSKPQPRSDFERSLPRVERGQLKNTPPKPAERSNMERLERGDLSNMNPNEKPRERDLGRGVKGSFGGPGGSVGGTVKKEFK